MADVRYRKLLEYISYFKNDKINFCTWQSSEKDRDGVLSWPYPIYNVRLVQFIDDVYKTDLMKQDYLDYLEKNLSDHSKMVESIADADIELLRAILTYYMRQERFGDGLWGEAAKDKIFYKLLKRLKQITKKVECILAKDPKDRFIRISNALVSLDPFRKKRVRFLLNHAGYLSVV